MRYLKRNQARITLAGGIFGSGRGAPAIADDPDALLKHDPRSPQQRERNHPALSPDPRTLVSLWDRSADSREGSHAAFVLRSELSATDALQAARAAFPGVLERIEAHLGRSVVIDNKL